MTGTERDKARRFLPSWRPVARLLTAFALVVAVLGAVPGAANAQTSTIFADDFESDLGWQTNPSGTDTATTGRWERGNPQSTSFSGTKQRGDTTSGSNALVTGASAGSSVGSNDVDNGVTSMRSPEISLVNFEDIDLSFDYYMAHLNNSSSADFFRVSVVGESSQVVFSEQGSNNDDDANWQRTTVDLDAFAGQTVRLLVEAADASGASLVEAAVDTLVITGTPVEVNTPPTVATPADQTSTEGDVVNLAVIGSDADEDPLTWSATGLPADLSINSDTGVISGTVAADAASETPYQVAVSATDGTDSTSVNFLWTVEEPALNQSPVVTNPPDQVSVEGDTVSLQLEATDPDGDPLQYFVEVLPPSLSLDRDTGIISGTLTEGSADGSPWGMFIAVTDGISAASLISFQWTVNPLVGNTPPAVTSPGDQASVEGEPISLAIVGTDADEDVLTWSATGLPADLSIDSASGVITGTVAVGAEDGSPYAVTVTADDGTDTTTVDFIWTVEAVVGNQPPVLVNPGDQASTVDDVVSLQIEATDVDDEPLFYLAESLPAGLEIDPSTGLISGTISADAVEGSPYDVVVSVLDGTNPAVSVNFVWTVTPVGVNQPPVVSSPGDQQSVEGEDVSLQLTASDPDGDALLYFVEVLPPGLTLGRTTGLISGTIADTGAEGSPYLVVVAVIDGNNPAVPISFNWTVTEPGANVPPVVTSPGDQQSDETDVVSLPVFGTDADEDVLTWSATGLPADLSIDSATGVISGTIAVGAEDGSPYAVAVTADDGTDTTTVDFTWTIGDAANEPPFVLNPGPQVGVDGDIVEGLQLTGTDPEGLPLVWSISGLPANLVIDQTGLISGTLADDASANSPYQVVATASDGVLSTNAVFEWIVTDGSVPNTIITGTITDADGVPFIPAEVDQYTVADNGERGEFILSRANVPNGTYTIFTEPGCYFMTFIAPEGQTYNGISFFTPPSFCVEVGETVTVDAQLDPIGVEDTIIGGTVTSTDGGASDVAVDLFQANPDGSRGTYLASTTTGLDGTYGFDVVPGCFVVTFIAPEGETFNGQSFFNASGCVEAGETNNTLDAAFDGVVGGDTAIGGTVTSGDGSPAASVGVDLFDQAADGSRGTWLQSTATNTDGVYNFAVDAGDYVVTFIAPAGETFNGDGFLSLPQSVADGQIITDLDAALDGAPEASIGGTVTDANGAPAPGVGADLFEANADGSRGAYLRSDVTGADGVYVLPATGGCFIVTLIATAGETFNDSQFLSLPQCIEDGENFTELDAQFDGEASGEIVVSIGNGATREGDIGELREVILPVTLSEASAVTESVTVSTSDDSAIAGEDYVALSTVVTFEPGETDKSVAFQVIGDEVFEEVDGADERFDVFLSAPSAGLVIGDGAGFARIIEDDEPGSDLVTVSVADAAATEADVNAPVTVTISLSAVAETDVSVDVATVDGTAVVVEDYMANSETVTIPAGELTADFAVMIVGDDVEEATEEFSVELSNPVGATIEDGTATVVITDDDEAVVLPGLSIADVEVTETDADALVTATVSLSAASGEDVLVEVADIDGSAVQFDDYLPVVELVIIPAGDLSATVDVFIVGDEVEEPEEEFTLGLFNPVGATIEDGSATVVITDDDEAVVLPGLSIADAAATETDADAPVAVTVSLSAVSETDVQVEVASADGSAVAADDYIGVVAVVTIPAGDLSATVDVVIVGDDIEEAEEDFTLTLSNPVGATIEDGTATVVITDDDAPVSNEVQISVSDVTVTELNDGLRNAVVTFSLDRVHDETVIVQFITVDGTATVADNDYLALSGEVRFPPGATSRIRAVKTVGDGNVEPDETLTVELSDPVNGVIADGVAVITILNND